MLCSCTDLERTASCIASAGHAWAVPISDMRGALRALYEVTIMPVFIAVYTKCISVIEVPFLKYLDSMQARPRFWYTTILVLMRSTNIVYIMHFESYEYYYLLKATVVFFLLYVCMFHCYCLHSYNFI